MNYIGMDIHKQFTYGVVEDKEGRVINEAKFDNSKENFSSFLKDLKPEETKIVIESTSVWEHIYEVIESLGYRDIKLANPVRTRAIAEAEAKVKTDHIDARTLADLLRANLIFESYIPPKEVRKLREIMRQRKTIVKGSTQIKNKIHAVLTRYGIKLPYKTLCESAMQWVIDKIKEYLSNEYKDLFENAIKELKEKFLKYFDECGNFLGAITSNAIEGGNWRIKFELRTAYSVQESITTRTLLICLNDSIFTYRKGRPNESFAHKHSNFSFEKIMRI